MVRIALILFLLSAIGVIVSQLIDSLYLHCISKPFIMITLGLYYLAASSFRSVLLLLAIFFSLAGDVFLMFERNVPNFFIAGLFAFLFAHIFYIFAYRQHQEESNDDALKGIQIIRFSFPIILAGTGLIVVLYPSLGSLKIPVIIYALVMIIMVLNSLFRYGRTSPNSFWLVFGGSVSFMLSDSLLAIDKFFKPLPAAGFWVMIFYLLAQFCIIKGLCDHVRQKQKSKK
jgi:uncharacterized membrane protein YhhN